MARIDQMEFGLGQVAEIGRRTLCREDHIVLSPDDDRRRLAVTKECLKFGVEWDIRAVVEEEIKLYVFISWSIKECLVMDPVIWINPS